MAQIFISYRREDSDGEAGAVYRFLEKIFGDGTVFIDFEGFQPGDHFKEAILSRLRNSWVCLVIMGPRWLTCRKHLVRRLYLPDDYVRLEIATAIELNIELIPVLVNGAKLPRRHAIPSAIAPLLDRNALPLNNQNFNESMERLVQRIKGLQSPVGGPVLDPKG